MKFKGRLSSATTRCTALAAWECLLQLYCRFADSVEPLARLSPSLTIALDANERDTLNSLDTHCTIARVPR